MRVYDEGVGFRVVLKLGEGFNERVWGETGRPDEETEGDYDVTQTKKCLVNADSCVRKKREELFETNLFLLPLRSNDPP